MFHHLANDSFETRFSVLDLFILYHMYNVFAGTHACMHACTSLVCLLPREGIRSLEQELQVIVS